MHASLRLLPDRHRQAGRTRPATSPGGSLKASPRWDPALCDSHRSRRDDLPDGGARLYAETVPRHQDPEPVDRRRTLDPRFQRRDPLLHEVFETRPEVLAHNLETVPRIFKRIRPAFRLSAQPRRHHRGARVRSGDEEQSDPRDGETIDEVHTALADLHNAGATSSPSPNTCGRRPVTHPVERWVEPSEFDDLDVLPGPRIHRCAAGPLVRSSYRAGRLYAEASRARTDQTG